MVEDWLGGGGAGGGAGCEGVRGCGAAWGAALPPPASGECGPTMPVEGVGWEKTISTDEDWLDWGEPVCPWWVA